MQTLKNEAFDIVGIKTRTRNDGQAGKDIPALWAKFMNEGILQKIQHKMDNSILCLYSNYEGDHTMPYDVVIGCRVSEVGNLPEGMIHHHVPATDSMKFLAKGNIEQGEAVIDTWMNIWKANLNRSYTTDYEVYDDRSMDRKNAEVDIFIALK